MTTPVKRFNLSRLRAIFSRRRKGFGQQAVKVWDDMDEEITPFGVTVNDSVDDYLHILYRKPPTD